MDREIRLVIKALTPAESKISTKSFVENLHRDNDIKLYISRLNHDEIREHTHVAGCGDLSRYEESKKVGKKGIDKDTI